MRKFGKLTVAFLVLTTAWLTIDRLCTTVAVQISVRLPDEDQAMYSDMVIVAVSADEYEDYLRSTDGPRAKAEADFAKEIRDARRELGKLKDAIENSKLNAIRAERTWPLRKISCEAVIGRLRLFPLYFNHAAQLDGMHIAAQKVNDISQEAMRRICDLRSGDVHTKLIRLKAANAIGETIIKYSDVDETSFRGAAFLSTESAFLSAALLAMGDEGAGSSLDEDDYGDDLRARRYDKDLLKVVREMHAKFRAYMNGDGRGLSPFETDIYSNSRPIDAAVSELSEVEKLVSKICGDPGEQWQPEVLSRFRQMALSGMPTEVDMRQWCVEAASADANATSATVSKRRLIYFNDKLASWSSAAAARLEQAKESEFRLSTKPRLSQQIAEIHSRINEISTISYAKLELSLLNPASLRLTTARIGQAAECQMELAPGPYYLLARVRGRYAWALRISVGEGDAVTLSVKNMVRSSRGQLANGISNTPDSVIKAGESLAFPSLEVARGEIDALRELEAKMKAGANSAYFE